MNCEPEIMKCNHCAYYKINGELSGKCEKYLNFSPINKEEIAQEVLTTLPKTLTPVTQLDIQHFNKELQNKLAKIKKKNK